MTGSAHYDIIIAGGGMVGTSLALALAPLNLRIAVVEAVAREIDTQPSFDERTTALSRSSQRTYEAMGLWPEIVAAATPIRRVHVSDQGRFGFAHIDAAEQKVEALGYVVVNRVLGNVLQAALASEPSVDLICPARITAADTSDEVAEVTVSTVSGSTSQLRSKLLVVADGARSAVRDMLGIGSQHKAYGQQAVIGNFVPEKPVDGCAYERFTPQGPLAVLPLGDDRAGFIWTVADTDAKRVLELADTEFLAAFQAAFGYRLGMFSRLGQRVAYPLNLSKALRLTATRAVLVGNAAHGLHPVAAQGFNLGLRDVAALCDCIARSLQAEQSTALGSRAMLAEYATWRQTDQRKLVQFTDSLVGLFAATRPPLTGLRNLGMLGFDLVPGVRTLFAKHTMGLAGKLPRLSRGVPLT